MRRIASKSIRQLNLLSAEVDIVPAYQDADPAGVVWHGNYFRYFDTARCALLDKLDYGYREMEDSGYLWPIIDTRVRYMKSATYDQPLRVTAMLSEWENRLKIVYEVLDKSGQCITEAYTMQAALEIATGEICLITPQPLVDRLAKLGIKAEQDDPGE